jgi:hypothetical protein
MAGDLNSIFLRRKVCARFLRLRNQTSFIYSYPAKTCLNSRDIHIWLLNSLRTRIYS